MPEVPSEIKKRVKAEYPTLEIRWDHKAEKFAVIEHYRVGAMNAERHICYYENADETAVPLISDHLMELLHMADTRKWPLPERLKAYRERWDADKAAKEREFRNTVADFYIDNAPYMTSCSRFFMDPKSMPEWKSKFMPSQERVLRKWGVI